MPSTPRQDLVHPRDAILRTMERIYRYRMTTTSGGNLSIREPSGDLWITPARVDKGRLRREDIVCVRADGTIEGEHPPSSELPFHQAVYRARPDVRGIVHAHPVALVAFSICGEVPETRVLPQAWRVCGRPGFARYALPGSRQLGDEIAGTFAAGVQAVVLENHGVVTAGDSLQSAFECFETLEFTAKTLLKARCLGPVRVLEEVRLRAAPTPGLAWATLPPRLADSRERELRSQLCDFVRRAYQQRLMISTEGAFSVRLGADEFLVTPHRVDRQRLDAEDIVRVFGDAAEAGKVPSQAASTHQAIYRQQARVASIANAYPVNATAFSITPGSLDTRTIPESYVFLREVERIPWHPQGGAELEVANRVRPSRPVWLLESDGVLVCGTSVLETFDRLEVLETTAEALLQSRTLGPLRPMTDEAIRELNQAFPPPE